MDKTEFREGKRINILYTIPDMFGFFYESHLSWNSAYVHKPHFYFPKKWMLPQQRREMSVYCSWGWSRDQKKGMK